MDIAALKEEQKKLAEKVQLVDGFEKIELIAGVDQAYYENKIVSAAIVMNYKTLEVVEVQHHVQEVTMPYIPGLLSYREAPASIAAVQKLENQPDLILVDGNGILHPRKFGLACHIGLMLDIPSIGIAKNLLCGELQDNDILIGNDIIGKQIETREKAKPIYISPGHKIGFKSMVEIIKHTLKGHKLPEPVHEAHKTVTKIRRKLKENTQNGQKG